MFKDTIGHSKLACPDNYKTKILQGNIEHLSYKNYHHLFKKCNEFSTRGAISLIKRDVKVKTLTPISHSISAFIRSYFFRGGYKHGYDGLTISIEQALHAYLKYLKARKLDPAKNKDLWGN